MKKSIYKRGTNICEGFKKKQIYMTYKPQKVFVFVTKVCRTFTQKEALIVSNNEGNRIKDITKGCVITIQCKYISRK